MKPHYCRICKTPVRDMHTHLRRSRWNGHRRAVRALVTRAMATEEAAP